MHKKDKTATEVCIDQLPKEDRIMDQVYFYLGIIISQKGDPEYIMANEVIPYSFK